jgi:hypothetical protein
MKFGKKGRGGKEQVEKQHLSAQIRLLNSKKKKKQGKVV